MGVQLTDGRDPRRRAEYEQKKKAFEEVMAPRSCDLGEFSFSHGESIIYIYIIIIYIYIILYILIYTFTNIYNIYIYLIYTSGDPNS
jgi:cell division protein FtsL